MTMKCASAHSGQNLLFILSDEHNPDVAGFAGHPEVKTPHMDALAAAGTWYRNAICASPICVPARAALATGRMVHEMGHWDNVDAYDGATPSWHHFLTSQGYEVTSIGKLHYRGWAQDDYGFSETHLPMHIQEGRGELKMLLRNPPASVGDGSGMLKSAKAGYSDYNAYDTSILERANHWLWDKARQPSGKPWVLFVSLVAPHFPLTVPEEYFRRYADRPLALPKAYGYGVAAPGAHPYAQHYGKVSGYNSHFKSEADVRRALAGYYGLISWLDDCVGSLMRTMTSAGHLSNTRVIYSSDHGDNLGARGLWGKSTMYRESVGIPLIIAGEGVSKGAVEDACVSQIDVCKTVADAVGLSPDATSASVHSRSLLRGVPRDRVVMSEYHTIGSRAGVFMVQNRDYKYVYYCDHPPELFDLQADPGELVNLASDPAHLELANQWHSKLLGFCDPVDVNARALRRQKELIEYYGGDQAIRSGQPIGGYTPAPHH